MFVKEVTPLVIPAVRMQGLMLCLRHLHGVFIDVNAGAFELRPELLGEDMMSRVARIRSLRGCVARRAGRPLGPSSPSVWAWDLPGCIGFAGVGMTDDRVLEVFNLIVDVISRVADNSDRSRSSEKRSCGQPARRFSRCNVSPLQGA